MSSADGQGLSRVTAQAAAPVQVTAAATMAMRLRTFTNSTPIRWTGTS
jgi:hypothetical protein